MSKFYQNFKEKLASADTLHIWLTYLLANIFACAFKFAGATDPLIYVILAPVLAWMVGVFVECFDGYFGTKQLDKTGIPGNIFSIKDIIRDAVGAVIAMITLGILFLI